MTMSNIIYQPFWCHSYGITINIFLFKLLTLNVLLDDEMDVDNQPDSAVKKSKKKKSKDDVSATNGNASEDVKFEKKKKKEKAEDDTTAKKA